MENHLKGEKSPYLLQHKDNPVDWYPWCRKAFEKAKKENKPIFLSIGYSTCHWCHVMARESFEDREVAEVLNRDYVCIKVDREERPDIDAVYMAACQAVTGAGGWPLTIVMTPEQKPFFAGTYFPKYRRYGHAGLLEILEVLSDRWKNHPGELKISGEEITRAIRENRVLNSQEPEKVLLHKAFGLYRRQFDPVWGGFGSAPKFPAAHNLLFLMRYSMLEADADALKMAEITLESMDRGGIHDHIGGGFSRYSTDDQWLIPHFEKMLYDNALLILAYLNAYQITGKRKYRETAGSTAVYLMRELKGRQGGFCCGQDADSEGKEGRFYVFTPEEVKKILGGRDGREFCSLYGMEGPENFDGQWVPNRIGQNIPGWEMDDGRLEKLYRYRLSRAGLHRDDKILLSWNGWAMIAFLRAGLILEKPEFLDAAVDAQRFIEECMTDDQNRLLVRFRDGEAAYLGQLDDYAVYTLALLELYRGTQETEYLQKAMERAGQIRAYFRDELRGGYFLTSIEEEGLIIRPKETVDGALPSGNAVVGLVFLRLAFLTGEREWQEEADRQLKFLAGAAADYPPGHSFALLAIAEALYPHRELVCAAKGSLPEAFVKFLRKETGEGLSILVKTPDNEKILSECAPYTKAYEIPDEGVLYYLCENGACRKPESDFGSLNL